VASFLRERSQLGEMEAIVAVCAEHHKGSALFLGNSMPVRDADSFYFPQEDVGPIFANRGLSGIDGNVATCFGIAQTRPVIAVMGDQTLLHDLNSLALLKKSRYPIHLVVINNGGGGIFSFIDIAEKKELLDPFFANAHGWNFEAAARLFDLPYVRAEDFDALKVQGKSCLVEFVCNRRENLVRHRALQEAIECLLSSSMVS
jgi:2-succinyl-5-enolpyruvyl-6-hydroxy-3-cyclohexene-1-carboxylate synthase